MKRTLFLILLLSLFSPRLIGQGFPTITNFNQGSFIVDPRSANPTNVIQVNIPFHGGAYDLPGNMIWWVGGNILNQTYGYVPFLAGPTNFMDSPWNVVQNGLGGFTTNKIAFNDTNYFIQRIPPAIIIGTNTVDTTAVFDIPSRVGAGALFLNDAGTYSSPGAIAGVTVNPSDTFVPYRFDATTFADSFLYRIAGGMGINTNIIFGPGTTNVLYRDSTGLVYTNGATDVQISILNNTGESASFENQDGTGVIRGINGAMLRNGTHQMLLNDNGFYPPTTRQEDFGLPHYVLKSVHTTNLTVHGFEDASDTNFVRLVTSVEGDTAILDIQSQTNAVNGPITGYSFRTNGVEVFGTSGGSTNTFSSITVTNFVYAKGRVAIYGTLEGTNGGGWAFKPTGTGTADAGSSNIVVELPTGFRDATLINSADIFAVGEDAGYLTTFNQVTNVYDIGRQSGYGGAYTNARFVMNIGDIAGAGMTVVDARDVFNFGLQSGINSWVTNGTYSVLNIGEFAGIEQSLDSALGIANYGYVSGHAQYATNTAAIYNYGDYAGQLAILGDSVGIYNYGEAAGDSATITNTFGVYNFGDGAFYGASADTLSDIYAFGTDALSLADLVTSTNVYAFGTGAGLGLSGTGYNDIYLFGSGAQPTRLTNEFVFGDSTYLYTLPGGLASSGYRLTNYLDTAIWGDSMTDGLGGLGTTFQLSGYNVYNGGNGGDSALQVATRMLADTDKYPWNTIIWAGRNNTPFSNTNAVVTNIQAMVNALGHTRYVVVNIFNSTNEDYTTATFTNLITLNTHLSNLFGIHYVDARQAVVDSYNPALPQDVIDNANNVCPNSLRYDNIHLNATGTVVVVNTILSNIFQKRLFAAQTNSIVGIDDFPALFASYPRAFHNLGVGGAVTTNNTLTVRGASVFYDNVGFAGHTTPAYPVSVGNNLWIQSNGVVLWNNQGLNPYSAIYGDNGTINLTNQGVAVFVGNGGSNIVANGVPLFPRGFVATGLNTDYPAGVFNGKVGIYAVSPLTALDSHGATNESRWAGDTTPYYGGGRQHQYGIAGNTNGDGSSYTAGVPNSNVSAGSAFKGGKAAAFFLGGQGGNYAGGGAGIVALGGAGGLGAGSTAEGGAGIYAMGGVSGDGAGVAPAAYFQGNVTITTNLTAGGNVSVTGTNFVNDLVVTNNAASATSTIGTATFTNTPITLLTTSWAAANSGSNYVANLAVPSLHFNMTTNLNIVHTTNGVANFTVNTCLASAIKVINNSGTNFPVSWPATWHTVGTVTNTFVLTNGDYCAIAIEFSGVSTDQTNNWIGVAYKQY